MKKVLLIILVLIFIPAFVMGESSQNFDIAEYDSLYKSGQYQDVINKLQVFLSPSEDNQIQIGSTISDSAYIHLCNLLADSYRMVGKYYEATMIYASISDDNAHAQYCLEIMNQSCTNKINNIINYSDDYSDFENEDFLYLLLRQLLNNSSLKDKRQYLSELITKRNKTDWITQLINYCAGNLALDKLQLLTPKEFTGTVNTYAGLNFEIQGNQSKAFELYRKTLTYRDMDNIEFLLASNKLGLFSLKRLYTTSGSKGNEVTKLAYVYSIKASSAKYEDKRLYSVQNLVDNDPKTTWVPDSKKSGFGEWVEFTFDDPILVNSLVITNGYTKSDTAFKNNNRVKTATLEFSDGSKQKVSLQDSMKPQVIKIGKRTQKIRLYIDEVYKGEKYDDTCLSEVEIKFDTPKE